MLKPITGKAFWGGTALLLTTAALAAAPRTVDNADLRYSIAIPSECRIEEGPGTFEAICAPDLDEAKSVEITAATSLLLEVDAEALPADAKPYTETEFRQDAPEAVCGEADNPKIKLDGFKETKDVGGVVYTASITCPDIKFLGLAERTAEVRYVTTPGFRYRLMARSLAGDGEQTKAAKQAFLASFKPTAEKKP